MRYKCDKCNSLYEDYDVEVAKNGRTFCPVCGETVIPVDDKYVAITTDGNTELSDEDDKDFYTGNSQVLLVDEANSLEEFRTKVKKAVEDFKVKNIWIYKIDTSFEAVRY